MSDKEVLYYTIKYGNKYYSPYLNRDQNRMMTSVEAMLTEKKHLAVRFGDKDTALFFKEQDIAYRTMLAEPDFQPELVKVVTVTKKVHTIQ